MHRVHEVKLRGKAKAFKSPKVFKVVFLKHFNAIAMPAIVYRPCQQLTMPSFFRGWAKKITFTGSYNISSRLQQHDHHHPNQPFQNGTGRLGQCFLDGCSLRQVNGSFSCLCGHLWPRRLQSNDGLLGMPNHGALMGPQLFFKGPC